MPVDRFPVEEGAILMFARAIGDPNPRYRDSGGEPIGEPTNQAQWPVAAQPHGSGAKTATYPLESSGVTSASGQPGVLAPPTFVRSSAQFDLDYPLRPRDGENWFGSGKEPTGRNRAGSGGDGGTGLHAEQHFTYHRPLHAGMVLRTVVRAGERWEKEGRSGKLVFSEEITEYLDADDQLIVTARSVGVMTERPVSQER